MKVVEMETWKAWLASINTPMHELKKMQKKGH